MSAKSETLWKRRPGLVGLRLRMAIVSSRRSRCGRRRRARRCARRSSGRDDQVPVRRLRLRLPLRLIVFTLVTRTLKIDSIALRISILLASERHDERVDVGVERRVRLLRHDGAHDDVARVAAHSAPPSVVVVASSVASAILDLDSSTSISTSTSATPPKRPIERGEGRAGEHDRVVDEHVVGVELVGEDDLHPLTEVAERLPHRFFGAVEHDEHPLGTRALRPAGRAPRAARSRPSCGARVIGQSETTTTLPSAQRSESAERSARLTIFFGVRCR